MAMRDEIFQKGLPVVGVLPRSPNPGGGVPTVVPPAPAQPTPQPPPPSSK